VSHEHTHPHLSDEQLQALLDGDLPAGEAREAHVHAEACRACAVRLERWEALFLKLEDLPALSPSPAFRARIVEALPRRAGAGARVRGWLGLDNDARQPAHVGPARLQEFMEGRLVARTAARVEAHLDGCAVCRLELEGHRAVALALESLPALAPTEVFAERVMAGVRIEQLARAALAPTTRTARIAAQLKRLVPSSSRGWAAALGVGVAPIVTAALVTWSVFSHPLVTAGSLASFVWLKTSALAGGLAQGLAGPLLENALFRQVWSLLTAVAQSPTLAAASAALLSGAVLFALWVLYRNVFSSHLGERGYAQPSL
jgi:anti-sigma factor RsiW